MSKADIRSQMIHLRNSMTQDAVSEKSEAIYQKIIALPDFQNASTLMAYMDFCNEVKTKPILEKAMSLGKKVFLPVCIPKGKRLLIYEIRNFKEDLTRSSFGILEPRKDRAWEREAGEVDLVLVPGVAFDRKCNRIGHGAGYYDRFFGLLPPNVPKIGLAYEEQILDLLPVEAHDIPLDVIVSDLNIYTRLAFDKNPTQG